MEDGDVIEALESQPPMPRLPAPAHALAHAVAAGVAPAPNTTPAEQPIPPPPPAEEAPSASGSSRHLAAGKAGCEGHTQKGFPCKRYALPGEVFCKVHRQHSELFEAGGLGELFGLAASTAMALAALDKADRFKNKIAPAAGAGAAANLHDKGSKRGREPEGEFITITVRQDHSSDNRVRVCL
jgi:hypothetical protein